MLLPLQLALALFQAEPVVAPTGDRLVRSTVISTTVISSSSNDRKIHLPINIGPTHYHPTVAYVPYQGPSARVPLSRPVATKPLKPIVYYLVVQSPAAQIQLLPQRQVHVAAKFAESTSNVAASAPPRLRSSVEIPVPDDLTLIQPKGIEDNSSESNSGIAKRIKTSIPRIERILGVDTSDLPVSSAGVECQAKCDEINSDSAANDEIPVPTLGS